MLPSPCRCIRTHCCWRIAMDTLRQLLVHKAPSSTPSACRAAAAAIAANGLAGLLADAKQQAATLHPAQLNLVPALLEGMGTTPNGAAAASAAPGHQGCQSGTLHQQLAPHSKLLVQTINLVSALLEGRGATARGAAAPPLRLGAPRGLRSAGRTGSPGSPHLLPALDAAGW